MFHTLAQIFMTIDNVDNGTLGNTCHSYGWIVKRQKEELLQLNLIVIDLQNIL